MHQRTVELLYGKSTLSVQVPAEATVLTAKALSPVNDAEAALERAMRNPIGSPSLPELVRARQPQRVAITISDITRPVPNIPIVTALLAMLNAEGVADKQVTVIVGTGMHRPSTPEERRLLLGDALLSRVRVLDHCADDSTGLVRISDAPPVSVNRVFAEADFRIVTGLIEPHFMAGYSGGRKGVCPALVDLATIQRFHGHAILSDPRSTTGILEDNPCHQESLRIAKLVGVDFLVNVTLGEGRCLAGVYAGDLEAAHLAGVKQIAQACSVVVDRPFDLVVTSGGGFPLDQTFYQTIKGMVSARKKRWKEARGAAIGRSMDRSATASRTPVIGGRWAITCSTSRWLRT